MGEIKAPNTFEDLTGERFGRLLVLKKAERKKSNTTRWECLCDCGKIIQTTRTSLIKGQSKSCGCLASELLRLRNKKHNVFYHRDGFMVGITNNTQAEFLFDSDDYDAVKEVCWHETVNGYIAGTYCSTIVTLHKLVLRFPQKFVDHINRDRLDNRKSNLRTVTYQQNTMNRSIQRNNKSGVPGVYFDISRGKWVGSLGCNGKKHIKRFENLKDAIAYRLSLEEEYFGEYAPTMSDEEIARINSMWKEDKSGRA